ncbi:MAG: hypothetical protein AB8B96_10065 [Lysobacterales bacterium]
MGKLRPIRCFAIAALITCSSAGAVRLSLDDSGQVLLFPLFLTGAGFQTIFEIRNQSDTGKALRLVVKDPVNARPTLSLNIYLAPGDSWSSALFNPDGEQSIRTASAVLARSQDVSCTFPERVDIPQQGIALTDDFFTEDLSNIIVSLSRLSLGFFEVYEMGSLDPTLAADCEEISRRWQPDGIWNLTPDQDIQAPGGGLEGYAVLVDVDRGRAHQYEALALEDFRSMPLHTDPLTSRQPSLMDVSPAESRVLETVRFGNRTLQVERVSSWSQTPIHAVDALLMATEARTDYSVSADLRATVFTTLNFPTRAYHVDAGGFYLAQGQSRVLAPFRTSLPLAAEENLTSNVIGVTSVDREGRNFELQPFAGRTNCDLANGAVTTVSMSNTINFSQPCDYIESEFRVPDNAAEGEVRYQLSGEIISDEGHVFSGLPIAGFVIQSLRNERVEIAPGVRGIADYGWARALKIERQVSDPP